jgi:hypothetical protein
MGSGSSKPAGGITRQQLLASTQNSRDFTNKLFQLMITKITPEDVLKLGKSQTCSSFVFMMADSIQNMFQSLRIRPRRDRSTGVVLFEKVDTLRAPTAETRELCLIIAYYYIRVFQIFAALALTLLDDPGAGQVLGAVRYAPPAAAAPAGFGLFRRAAPAPVPGRRGPFILSGGAEEKYFLLVPAAKSFLPLRSLFGDPILDKSAQRLLFPFEDDKLSNYRLIPGRVEGSASQNLRIDLDNSRRLYGNFALRNYKHDGGASSGELVFNNFNLHAPDADSNKLKIINSKLRTYETKFPIASTDNNQTWFSLKNTDVPEMIEGSVKKVTDLIEKLEASSFEELAQIRDLKKGALEKGLLFDRAGLGAAGVGAAGVAAAGRADVVGIVKQLQNEYLIQTLKGITGQKSIAFCVARALQLLDSNTLFTPKPQKARTGVCATRFEAVPTAVPQPGMRIESVPGIRALDQLYYTQPVIGAKDETQIQVGDAAEYADFLKKMSDLFGKPIAGTTQLTGIDRILAKDPNCPSAAAKHYLQIQDPKAIAGIMGIVNQLFARQLAHTQKVLKFFREQLFLIRKIKNPATGLTSESIELHPRIVQGGLDALAVVSKLARELLLEYYKGCEETYQRGVALVFQARSVPV